MLTPKPTWKGFKKKLGGRFLKRQYLNKVGRKGKANAKATVVLRATAKKLGIDYCEARLENCNESLGLTWSHGRKRRNLKPGELETFAIRSCLPCHRDTDEKMTPEQQAVFVEQRIAERNVRCLP